MPHSWSIRRITAIEALASCCASRRLPFTPAIAARMPSAYPSFQPSPAAWAMDSASSARAAASSTCPVCRATSASRLSPDAVQKASPASRHSASPSSARDLARAGSLGRVSWARPIRPAPRISGGTCGASTARKEASHSLPSAKVPRTIQHGRTAVQIRSPVAASPSARQPLSTSHTLPISASYRRNTSTRADQGASILASPIARFRSATATV